MRQAFSGSAFVASAFGGSEMAEGNAFAAMAFDPSAVGSNTFVTSAFGGTRKKIYSGVNRRDYVKCTSVGIRVTAEREVARGKQTVTPHFWNSIQAACCQVQMLNLMILDERRRSSLTHYRFCVYPNYRRAMTAGARSNWQEFVGQVRAIEDGTIAGAANRIAGIPRRIDSGEARFSLVGMELGVPGDGPGVAAQERLEFKRVSIAPGEMAEKKQFPLLSRMNPGKFVRDVEVDMDLDEVPAITPLGRLRIEEEHRGAQAPRKRKLDEEEEKAHVPSEKARRPSGQRDRLAARARVPTPEVCLALEQVPFDDAPSAQGPSAQVLFKVTSDAPSAQGPSGQVLFKDQRALARKLQEAALKLRDEMVANARRKIDELRAKVQTDCSVEQIQMRI
ncbi:hypothetical protein AXG93_1275s1100 [Marchantia polymorpha subsp. ruderalis]|uniref:Uncharacterized protein n=1 Tax=Marchantia polymorpha subsp. ruderalis TaxID=1480154 RepID=A0A176VL55_MARPO|nr:hypothetical protein AXG93_1275s1100 [Marchantia polymorpha subsp. ruderalis]